MPFNREFSKSFKSLLLAGTMALALSACQATTQQASESDRINATLDRIAEEQSTAQGYTVESMKALERLYRRDSENPDIAARYAQALRQNDRLNRAAMILRPFAKDASLENVAVDTEYAAINTAMGNYLDAETYARKAVLLDPESGKAYHLLGISLDAQSKHKQAETAYRKALDYWKGDPSPVMNNLGLNLASQGFFDDALETLRKALATSSGRAEIERNIRIVSALQSSIPAGSSGPWKRTPPKPDHKPDYNS